MPVVFGGSSKIVSLKTNNFNAQILGLLLNVYSSYAKIRVPDPLLVFLASLIMCEKLKQKIVTLKLYKIL